MLDLLRLKIFLLVADLKSLALAAKHLNLSSAAISKQLTKLEKEVGVQLLTRTTRQVELTEIGKTSNSIFSRRLFINSHFFKFS